MTTKLVNIVCSPNWSTLCNQLSSQHRVITYLLNIVWSPVWSPSCDDWSGDHHKSGQHRSPQHRLTAGVWTILPSQHLVVSIVDQHRVVTSLFNILRSASFDQHRVVTSLFNILRSASFDQHRVVTSLFNILRSASLINIVWSPVFSISCDQHLLITCVSSTWSLSFHRQILVRDADK